MLYIILPVYNRKNITENFIKCLVSQTYQNFKVILIDSGSDGTAEMVVSYLPSTVVMRGKDNWWWGNSLHQAYLWIKNQKNMNNTNMLIINDDSIIKPNFLEIGISLLQKSEKSLYLAKAISLQNNSKITGGIHINWKNLRFKKVEKIDEINCLSTRGLFLKIKDFLDIGDFHPFLLPHYLSDYEYTIRAYKKGYELLVDDELFLKYNEKTTGCHSIKANNKITFLKKYFSKKNPSNPIYFIFFIILSAPLKYKINLVIKVIAVNVKKMLIFIIKNLLLVKEQNR